jgi:hypothetical protein
MGSTGKLSDRSSWSEQPGCPTGCRKSGTGQYGGVGLIWSGRKAY